MATPGSSNGSALPSAALGDLGSGGEDGEGEGDSWGGAAVGKEAARSSKGTPLSRCGSVGIGRGRLSVSPSAACSSSSSAAGSEVQGGGTQGVAQRSTSSTGSRFQSRGAQRETMGGVARSTDSTASGVPLYAGPEALEWQGDADQSVVADPADDLCWAQGGEGAEETEAATAGPGEADELSWQARVEGIEGPATGSSWDMDSLSQGDSAMPCAYPGMASFAPNLSLPRITILRGKVAASSVSSGDEQSPQFRHMNPLWRGHGGVANTGGEDTPGSACSTPAQAGAPALQGPSMSPLGIVAGKREEKVGGKQLDLHPGAVVVTRVFQVSH